MTAVEHAGVATEEQFLYGIIAEFEHAEDVVAAARKAHNAGYRRMDAYSPFPVEGLSDALGHRDHAVPLIMLCAGLIGAVGGFTFLYYCTVISNPFNIAGRPLFGWPYYIPITFEITVLLTALSGFFGMLILNGLPQPYHPVFDAPDFVKATSSRFFLCIESHDPRFDRAETRRFMETLGAEQVSEVELRK